MRAQNVTIGDYGTFDDWGLWLTSLDEGEALPKTVIVDVPGANGSLDLTEALTGEPTYSNRTVTIGLARDCGTHAQAVALYRAVKKAIHGLRLDIKTPDTGEGWYTGRVTVGEPEMPDGALFLTVTADCDPFMYTGTIETQLAASAAETVTCPAKLTSSQTASVRYGACSFTLRRVGTSVPQSAFNQAAISFARNENLFDMRSANIGGALWLGKSKYADQYTYTNATTGTTGFLWDETAKSIRFVSKETDNNGYGDEGSVKERASQLVITAMPMPWETVPDASGYAKLNARGTAGSGLAFNAFTRSALDWHVIVNGDVMSWSSDWGTDAGVEVVVGRRALRDGRMAWTSRYTWHTEAGSSEDYITEQHTFENVVANTILVCVRGIECDLNVTVYANAVGTDDPSTPSISTQVFNLSSFAATVKPYTISAAEGQYDEFTVNAVNSRLLKNTIAYDYANPCYPSAMASPSSAYGSMSLDVPSIGAATRAAGALAVGGWCTDVAMSATLTCHALKTATLANDDMPAVPTLRCTVPVVIRKDGNTYINASGTRRLPIHVPRGSSTLQYATVGSAAATLTWNTGVL